MKILAIDPGYERVGIAVLEKEGARREVLCHSECFTTSSKLPHHERLHLIGARLNELIETHQPQALAIETLFFNTNQKTAMPVSEARGTIMYECTRHNMNVVEFTPPQIKVAVTGHGRSDKKAVIKMIPLLIPLPHTPRYDDEYDAIAVGLTFFATGQHQ